MNRIACLVCTATSIAAVTLLVTAQPATATRPADGGPPGPPLVVQRVEIPVPVDDSTAELVQMQIAATLGAAVAAVATRRRRDERGPQSFGGVIDITDTVTPSLTGGTSTPVNRRARRQGGRL